MSNTERSQIKNKSCTLERVTEGLLIDRNIVNEHVTDRRAYLVPFRPVVGKPPDDYRVPSGELHVVVVRMLATHRDDVWSHYRCCVHSRRQRIGNNLGSLAGGNLEEIVTKVFDSRVGRGGIGQVRQASGDVGLAARPNGGSCAR